MEKKVELSRVYLAAIVLVVLLVGYIAGTRSEQIIGLVAPLFGARVETGTLDDKSLQEAYKALKSSYNGTISDATLIEGAKEGMVAAVGDPYTVYFSKKEANDFNKELSGEIGGGIGAEIGVRSGQPTILRTLPDNPAEAAGLNAGDVILAVNDESANGWDAERATRAIRGEKDTSVKLTVKRGQETKQFTITRAIINNPSVSSKLTGDAGILTISRFDQDTVSLVRKQVTDLKSRGMKRLVVDMRGNGGGYLDDAPGVAGMWLDRDKLVVSVKSNGGSEQKLYAEGDTILKGIKTAVVVNGGSASATEIVTAALKHYKVATIVGEKTFGKGTVQELVPLSNETLLKVTIKRWYTPSGSNVNGKGIEPDVKAGLTQTDLDKGSDPQLEKALQLVK